MVNYSELCINHHSKPHLTWESLYSLHMLSWGHSLIPLQAFASFLSLLLKIPVLHLILLLFS